MKYSIIIPFRDRFEHLEKLVPELRSLAEFKNLDFEIIISEQIDDNNLRRGALRNEGARVATGDVFIFHDVDYLPYSSYKVTVDYWPGTSDVFRAIQKVKFVNMDGTPRPENDTPTGYRTFKDGIDDNFFGGVLCMTKSAFNKTNGYNPLYEGWGLEDDDFRERIYSSGLKVESGTGTFLALPHPDSYKDDDAFKRNQQLFADREKTKLVGMMNTTVKSVLNLEKAEKHGVDKWVESTDWEVYDPTSYVMHQPRAAQLDYGNFLLLNNVSLDHVQNAVASGNRWEPDIMSLCEKYVKPNTTVVDIGANIGTFTVRLSQLVGPAGVVIAFEPQRYICQQLCANLFLNDIRNVFTYQLAISNKESEVVLTPINYDYGAPGEVRIHGEGGERVKCVPLDMFELTDVSLIKIDVERYEPFVFTGAQNTIETNRPVILFELTTLPLPMFPPDYILDYLKRIQYNVYKVSDQEDYIGLPEERDDNS